jgi:hypothetical protein
MTGQLVEISDIFDEVRMVSRFVEGYAISLAEPDC